MDARSAQEFSEFVAARSLAMLRVARVLTGDQDRVDPAGQPPTGLSPMGLGG